MGRTLLARRGLVVVILVLLVMAGLAWWLTPKDSGKSGGKRTERIAYAERGKTPRE